MTILKTSSFRRSGFGDVTAVVVTVVRNNLCEEVQTFKSYKL
jgi:hypothetical protein